MALFFLHVCGMHVYVHVHMYVGTVCVQLHILMGAYAHGDSEPIALHVTY